MSYRALPVDEPVVRPVCTIRPTSTRCPIGPVCRLLRTPDIDRQVTANGVGRGDGSARQRVCSERTIDVSLAWEAGQIPALSRNRGSRSP